VYSKLHLPEDNQMTGLGGGSISLSPDGLKIAFVAHDTVTGEQMLWVRPFNSGVALQLPGTENAYFPFWSHDNRYIAFFSGRDQKLKKILASGGPALTICDASNGRPGGWSADDVILFSPTADSPIYRVSASGGESSPVTTLDSSLQDVTHRWAKFLPDGDHFIFFIRTGTGGGSENDVIAVSSLSQPKVIKRILHTKSSVAYSQGHILYMRENTLMARPFDVGGLEFTADGFPIAENISYLENWSRGVFSASPDGKLAFREGSVSTGSQLVIYDSIGGIIDSVDDQVQQYSQEWSPDETQIAVDINDQSSSQWDIWIHHLGRGIKTRLTFDSDDDYTPVWSPNGEEIAYITDRGNSFEINIKPISGAGAKKLVHSSNLGLELFDWSADGRYLVFGKNENAEDLWALELKDSAEAFPLFATEFREREARFSPDGRWIAYMSTESGKEEVYVSPFPGPGGKWQVSNNEGDRPHWSADGTKLFYLDNDETINVAEVDGSGSGFRVGKVKKLFEINGYRPSDVYEVSNDGSRFLVNSKLQDARPTTTITLIQNWHAEINK
jgi:Tol biopolymer transport system component